jgi:urate oxidase
MAVILTHNSYGKSRVRLSKITRRPDRHEFKECTVDIRLEGDFEASYTRGDNSRIVATDTMKNAVYALARTQTLADLESFGLTLSDHFMANYAHVAKVVVELADLPWQRLVIGGREHPHAFIGGGSERRICLVTRTRQEKRIESGLDGLRLLKTTDSAFKGFLRDAYTTLPETDDRIFATMLSAQWRYGVNQANWGDCHRRIRQAMIDVFANHHSLSVQQTLHAMGTAALDSGPEIRQITLTMPNQHRLLVNLTPFGLDNPNEIFVATDEPFGLISAALTRE